MTKCSFKYIVSYSELALEFISDEIQLLELNFFKGKKGDDGGNVSKPIKKAISYLDDYFNGKRSSIEIVLISGLSDKRLNEKSDRLFLDMTGYTEKEVMIYKNLLKVKSGETISYGELAMISGIPNGGRFAGNCMAGNRFPVIIPCHRVIKSDGSMGNYTGGVGIKEYLVKYER